ncbi:MAG: hypothetical protein EOP85_22795 [Verrucomicrobiaceae bacterium]|nr:MAG: hypothetical protein EOP85_22795 [Verrucomicrobiaceae bacterium]
MPTTAPAQDPSNPYSTPGTTWTDGPTPPPQQALDEIPHGSEPLDVAACVKRGFELTTRNFGMILLSGLIYFAVTMGAGIALSVIDVATGWNQIIPNLFADEAVRQAMLQQQVGSPMSMIANHLISMFLSLGFVRIGLNIASGHEFSVSMLFGEGKKLIPAVGAGILYSLMVVIGCLLLIVPGVYLAIRYGQYMNAMVDRNLGVMESFRYSSSITTNNRWNLFLLAILCFLIALAGVVALCVGVVFAVPVAWLSTVVAYRWLQYGSRAAMDHPGTTIPMLVNRNR